jgi:hypothetical protein
MMHGQHNVKLIMYIWPIVTVCTVYGFGVRDLCSNLACYVVLHTHAPILVCDVYMDAMRFTVFTCTETLTGTAK